MWRLYVVVALVWIAALPPFFTNGACDREFEAISSRVSGDARKLRNVAAALDYWQAQTVAASVLTAEQCAKSKPRFVNRCPGGTLVHADVPVQNLVCRVYRDDAVRIELHYTERDQLVRVSADMQPDKILRIPFTQGGVHWGR